HGGMPDDGDQAAGAEGVLPDDRCGVLLCSHRERVAGPLLWMSFSRRPVCCSRAPTSVYSARLLLVHFSTGDRGWALRAPARCRTDTTEGGAAGCCIRCGRCRWEYRARCRIRDDGENRVCMAQYLVAHPRETWWFGLHVRSAYEPMGGGICLLGSCQGRSGSASGCPPRGGAL